MHSQPTHDIDRVRWHSQRRRRSPWVVCSHARSTDTHTGRCQLVWRTVDMWRWCTAAGGAHLGASGVTQSAEVHIAARQHCGVPRRRAATAAGTRPLATVARESATARRANASSRRSSWPHCRCRGCRSRKCSRSHGNGGTRPVISAHTSATGTVTGGGSSRSKSCRCPPHQCDSY